MWRVQFGGLLVLKNLLTFGHSHSKISSSKVVKYTGVTMTILNGRKWPTKNHKETESTSCCGSAFLVWNSSDLALIWAPLNTQAGQQLESPSSQGTFVAADLSTAHCFSKRAPTSSCAAMISTISDSIIISFSLRSHWHIHLKSQHFH